MGLADLILIALVIVALVRDSRLGDPGLADSLRERAKRTRELVSRIADRGEGQRQCAESPRGDA